MYHQTLKVNLKNKLNTQLQKIGRFYAENQSQTMLYETSCYSINLTYFLFTIDMSISLNLFHNVVVCIFEKKNTTLFYYIYHFQCIYMKIAIGPTGSLTRLVARHCVWRYITNEKPPKLTFGCLKAQKSWNLKPRAFSGCFIYIFFPIKTRKKIKSMYS